MKTALNNFLEQIVLKKVCGSVYLVSAITDIQIQEAKELFMQQIIEAYTDGFANGIGGTFITCNEYFNQTFKP